jgi:hypothetical protein
VPYFSPDKTLFAKVIVGEKQIRRDENSYITLRVVISLNDYPFSIFVITGRTRKRSLYHEIDFGQDRLD